MQSCSGGIRCSDAVVTLVAIDLGGFNGSNSESVVALATQHGAGEEVGVTSGGADGVVVGIGVEEGAGKARTGGE